MTHIFQFECQRRMADILTYFGVAYMTNSLKCSWVINLSGQAFSKNSKGLGSLVKKQVDDAQIGYKAKSFRKNLLVRYRIKVRVGFVKTLFGIN